MEIRSGKSIAFLVLAALNCAGNVAAAPAAGDAWAYRVVNRYSNEVRGSVQYRVEKADADRVAVAVSSDVPSLGLPRTDIYTSDGRWLKHPLINHDQPVIYEFAQPYPAYEFPLAPGKSWSSRVNAVNAANGRRVSVRVDGEVVGSEQVTTPAGTFDTVKIKRRIYAGDFEGNRMETNITETEWYAPALGRAVRLERASNYMDQGQCTDEMSACRPVRGDWDLFELVSK